MQEGLVDSVGSGGEAVAARGEKVQCQLRHVIEKEAEMARQVLHATTAPKVEQLLEPSSS
jgi:hypothetical protein